ncbi:MAG TPA: hypothetical protein VFD88_00315 [Clostridia bacterium]|nr:hypothetical protein [Clostridia bacterium]
MRDLGDVLELLHTSPERWNTLRLAGREWRHVARFNQAYEQSMAAVQRNSRVGSVMSFAPEFATGEAREPPEATVEHWRLWHAKPDKIRTQFLVGSETVTAVFAGSQWWSWSRSMGYLTNTGGLNASHGLGPAEVLVETPSLLGSLKLQTVSRTTFLSRSAYLVGAIPANLDEHAPPFVLHALGTGADRYELVVDAEVGVVWRSQAELGGEAFLVLEVDELGINEPLGDDLFRHDNLGA